MKGKSIETTEPSSWELMNFRPTAVAPARDRTRASACGRQLCSLFCLRDPWLWDQDVSPVHELTRSLMLGTDLT